MNPIGGIYRYWTDLENGFINQKVDFSNVKLWQLDKKSALERFLPYSIHDRDCNVVHSSYYRVPAKKQPGVKSVITAYDCIHERYRSGITLKTHVYAKSKALHDVDHVIAISESTKNDLIHYYDVPEEKISVCHLNVNPIFSHQNSTISHEKRGSYPNLKNYFLFVGARKRYKNFWLAVEAVSHTNDAHLYVCGGGSLSSDEKMFLQRKLPGRFRYFPFPSMSDLKQLYQGSLALLYPSDYEGFGLPPMECILSGGKAIFQDTSSLSEITPKHYQGKIPFQDYDAYIEKVKCLASNDSYCEWGVPVEYLQHWSQFSMVLTTLKIYNKILDE